MTSPSAFCLRCRALLDAGQTCECGAKGLPIPLDDAAADRIEAELLVAPKVEPGGELRAAAAGMLVLGPIAFAFFFGYHALNGVAPAVAEQWPWFLGLPYLAIAIGWVGFLWWSAIEDRKPYCGAAVRSRPRPEATEEGLLETGSIVATEIHQRLSAHDVVVRDGRIEEPLLLRRSGQQIVVPVGRVDVLFAPERFRAGSTPLVSEWGALPRVVFTAGALRKASAHRGERVVLYDGHLEPLEREETGFREAAEERFRWVPAGGRTRIAIGHALPR
ncbi:MAG: hypothetical protein H6719_30210 [Sandaracinaceae bacterium]|nr:hypothetical protein [Sandaracinaceae bacterium]